MNFSCTPFVETLLDVVPVVLARIDRVVAVLVIVRLVRVCRRRESGFSVSFVNSPFSRVAADTRRTRSCPARSRCSSARYWRRADPRASCSDRRSRLPAAAPWVRRRFRRWTRASRAGCRWQRRCGGCRGAGGGWDGPHAASAIAVRAETTTRRMVAPWFDDRFKSPRRRRDQRHAKAQRCSLFRSFPRRRPGPAEPRGWTDAGAGNDSRPMPPLATCRLSAEDVPLLLPIAAWLLGVAAVVRRTRPRSHWTVEITPDGELFPGARPFADAAEIGGGARRRQRARHRSRARRRRAASRFASRSARQGLRAPVVVEADLAHGDARAAAAPGLGHRLPSRAARRRAPVDADHAEAAASRRRRAMSPCACIRSTMRCTTCAKARSHRSWLGVRRVRESG